MSFSGASLSWDQVPALNAQVHIWLNLVHERDIINSLIICFSRFHSFTWKKKGLKDQKDLLGTMLCPRKGEVEYKFQITLNPASRFLWI